MNDSPSIECIERDLASALNGSPMDDTTFQALAIKVFTYQYTTNIAYQRYCDSLNIHPNKLQHWTDIPAIPTDAFKIQHLPLTTFPLNKTHKTFLTSGTTNEIKGQHHFPSTSLYEQSIIRAWSERQLPLPRQAIFLTASSLDAPHSSLSHMMDVLDRKFSQSSVWAVDHSGKIDTQTIVNAIQAAQKTQEDKKNEPIALLGTALAFLHVFDQINTPLELPPGSWAMETGGYKGTNRHMEKADLYQLFEQKLGLSSNFIFNEYSMTELSSQFYTQGLDQPHTGPGWTRVRIINPLTNTDCLAGEPGHLVIYDLANLHSVMAIRTQDIAVRSKADLAEKHPSFTLLGRDPSALPRGCSRAADDQLSS